MSLRAHSVGGNVVQRGKSPSPSSLSFTATTGPSYNPRLFHRSIFPPSTGELPMAKAHLNASAAMPSHAALGGGDVVQRGSSQPPSSLRQRHDHLPTRRSSLNLFLCPQLRNRRWQRLASILLQPSHRTLHQVVAMSFIGGSQWHHHRCRLRQWQWLS